MMVMAASRKAPAAATPVMQRRKLNLKANF
jgi:hypothetical protein